MRFFRQLEETLLEELGHVIARPLSVTFERLGQPGQLGQVPQGLEESEYHCYCQEGGSGEQQTGQA